MSETKSIWEELREHLKKNFPKDSGEIIEVRLWNLKEFSPRTDDKQLELYLPKSPDGVVLRVGVRLKGTNTVSFCETDTGKESHDILSLEEV